MGEKLVSELPAAVLPFQGADLFVMTRDSGTLWKGTFNDFVAYVLGNANLTGNPVAPTIASIADASTSVVNAAFLQAVIAAYVASVGAFNDRGAYNASTNLFPATGGSGILGSIKKGDTWELSAPGTLGTAVARIGDTIRALSDTPGQTAANWSIGAGFDVQRLSAFLTSLATAGTVTDALASLSPKPAVTLVATANLTFSGAQTIDGQLGTAGTTLVLATAQSSGAQNGPWVMQAGAWTRPAWYPAGGTTQAFQFITCLVRLGTTYQGSTWRMTTSGAITIDTTATAWAVTPLALNANTLSGQVPIGNGGTGASTAVDGADALSTKGANIASATTTDLSTATGNFVDITGAATITGLGTMAAGVERTTRTTGAPLFTHNGTSLILPGGANIQAAANDLQRWRSLGSGNWICVAYLPATGLPIADSLLVHKAGAETLTGVKTILRLLSGGVTDDTVTPYQGIGAGSFARFGTATADCSLFAGAAANAFFGVGAYWNGTNFVATATTAILVGGISGFFAVYVDSGLTPGGTFTPTLRMSENSVGLNMFVRLLMKAGGTAALSSPILFASGGPMTVAVAGNMEYDGRFLLTKSGGIRFPVGGTLFDHFADAGNITTGETDLYSDSTPASLLDVNGHKISAVYGLSLVAALTATRTIRAYYGGTLVLNTGALTSVAAVYAEVRVAVMRESSTVVRVLASVIADGKTCTSTVTRITGLTLTNAQILKITGQAGGVGAATNDIVANMGTVRFDAAA